MKTAKKENKEIKTILVDVEKKLNEIFGEKAPKLPESVGEFIVKVGPYLMVVGLVIGIGTLLTSFGILAAITPWMRAGYSYGYSYRYHYGFAFWNIFSLATMVLQAMAVPGLFKRAKSAWNLMFYASLINVLTSLFSSGLISAAISAAIGWYFLFQIRKFYK